MTALHRSPAPDARPGSRPTGAAPVDGPSGDRALGRAAVLFALVVLVHNADHLRRGFDAVPLDVFWAGTASIVVEVGVVALVLARHRLAPLAALSVGAALAPAYVVVHFLPARSWLSDSFTSAAGVSPLSWTAASLEVVGATVLALAGWAVLRRRGGLASAARPHGPQQPLRRGLLHPVTATLLAVNVVIVAVSLGQV